MSHDEREDDPKTEAPPLDPGHDEAHPTGIRPSQTLWRTVEGVSVAGALIHPAALGLARYSWLADLLTHFQNLALVASALALVITARRRRWLAVALATLAAFQVAPLLRYSGQNPVPPELTSPAKFRIVFMNLLVDNTTSEDAIHLIRTERPDVLGLIEYTPTWYLALATLRDEYPWRIEAVSGADGLGLWFRKPPLRLERPEWLTPDGWPVLHATFEFAGKSRHLWLIHPRSPLKPERRIAGFPELAAIAARVGATEGSRIVIGDFNTSEGSPHFADFERVSGLRDSRLGFGRQPSWPTMQPYRLPIDHAFLSEDLAVVDRRLGHMIGSDHFPVVLDLAPPAIASRKALAESGQAPSTP